MDLGHVAEVAISAFAAATGVGVPVALYIASNKKSARADVERRDKVNQEKLDELLLRDTYLRPHDHQEQEGPLMAEGIIRKRNGK